MRFTEALKLALVSIWSHKLRSALTLLGMIIGIMSVVVVVSLIQGFNVYVDEKIAGIGAKSFSLFRFNFMEDFKDSDSTVAAERRNKVLTMEDFEFLHARATSSVALLGAKAFPTGSQVRHGSELLEDVQVDGAMASVALIENAQVEDGRFFNESENERAMRVAYVGFDVASKFFAPGAALGQEIIIAGMPYRIVGVAAAKGSVFGMPQDNFITVPIKTYAKDFGPLIRQRELYIVGTAKSDELFDDAVEEVRQLMRERRRLRSNEKDNFGLITPDAITGLRDRIFGPIFIVAIAVPGIALVVGGIVIMNIMLVSVTERTHEIGIRKTLGARRKDILKQFLIEAVALSIIGGIIGVVSAWLIGRALSAAFFPTYLSVTAIVVAVAVSAFIGICSGIFPAWKAARLDPIEALRAE
ncbi:MAG TPA: ABC transporter permease [Pyrinomonadaceae bacterium]|nr:ABC transporter permease [Pyrinomonadaceae bacterium]